MLNLNFSDFFRQSVTKISSNINEGIKAVLFIYLFIYLFYQKISHIQKAQKAQKVNKQLSLRRFILS